MIEGHKNSSERNGKIAEEVIRYVKEQMGICPEKVSVDIHSHSVTVTLEGVSHPAEMNLAKKQLSRSMIQNMYSELFNISKQILHFQLEDILCRPVERSFFTVDPQYGSAVLVLFFSDKSDHM
ncbi:hypothetical protein CHISP_1470 [Chitinispirillum alkaliphilum]|nr:hypothetical protein CHISP_1470 [Chitinispirillum alkaliphilum]